jgi:non-specific serine/threonine protein kinase
LQEAASEQTGSPERLERDHDNFRAALSWLLDSGRVDDALRFGAALCRFWSTRGYFTEGMRWMRCLLAMPGGDASIRIRVLIGAGLLAFTYDDLPSARDYDAKALALARETDDLTGIAMALYRVGDVARAEGKFAESHAHLDAAMNASRAIDHPGLQAHCCFGLGNLALAEGNLDAGRAWLSEALTRFHQIGNRRDAAVAARRLGVTLYRLGERAEGRSLLENAFTALGQAGDRWQTAMALWELGAAAVNENDLERAWELLTQGLRLSRDLGDRGRVCWYLQAFAQLAIAQGQLDRALRLDSAASALGTAAQQVEQGNGSARRTAGWQWSVMGLSSIAGDYRVLERQLHSAAAQLGQRRAVEARQAGARLSLKDAIACALTPDMPVDAANPLPIEERRPYGLTARELDVVRLAAEGKTNRQIAEVLILSDKTVKRHFDNVFAKLGVSSRAAATAAVLRAFH